MRTARKTILPPLLLLLLLPAACAAYPEKESGETRTARTILDEAMASMGGARRLAKIEGMRSVHEGVYRFGEMQSPYRATQLFVRPDCLRWEMSSMGFGAAMGIDHGTPWSRFMCPPARCRGPQAHAMRQWLLQLDMMLIRPLLDRKDTKLSVGLIRDSGVETVVVEVRDLGRYELGFAESDGATRLVSLRGDWTAWDGRKGRVEMTWSEPRAFGDITLPSHAVTRTYLGGELVEEMEETATSIEWNPEVEKGAFAMPAPEMSFDAPAVRDVPDAIGIVLPHAGGWEKVGETVAKASALLLERKITPAGQAIALAKEGGSEPAEVFVAIIPMGGPPEDLPDGVAVRTIPAHRAASMYRRGEYGTVEASALTMLSAWAKVQGHEAAGPPRVVYYHDPSGVVPEDQISEVRIPVAGE